MKQIPNESINKWAYANSNKLSHPVSLATICPGCSLNVVFSTKRRMYDANRDTSSSSADCPACGDTVHFWVVDMVAHARQDGEGQPGVYMLPAPQTHMQIEEYEDVMPGAVLQYCKTAQDIYFSGNLMATNVLIKTALETVFDDFLPTGNSRGNLPSMIRDSISTINHNEPLAKLSSSTGKQGDLAALFKNHNGTNKETADAMMQLLETLIEYLYVLPSKFKQLESVFADLRSAADQELQRQEQEKRLENEELRRTRALESLEGEVVDDDNDDNHQRAA